MGFLVGVVKSATIRSAALNVHATLALDLAVMDYCV